MCKKYVGYRPEHWAMMMIAMMVMMTMVMVMIMMEEYLMMVQGWLIIVMLTNENGIVGPDKTF